MKVYTLETSGFQWWNLVGIYNSRELAREDFEFIKNTIIDRSKNGTMIVFGV